MTYRYLQLDGNIFRHPDGDPLAVDMWQPKRKTWRRVDEATAIDPVFNGMPIALADAARYVGATSAQLTQA